MRLINTSDITLTEPSSPQRYAILSHTWGKKSEEVSFQEMVDPSFRSSPKSGKPGFEKIEKTCAMAHEEHGLKYAWVDTCCIDKSSSAELSEAINSMFRWYQRSDICYVFLSDLPELASLDKTLHRCRWFARGWTLQELIAARNIQFFDQGWNCIGTKAELVHLLSKITGINPAILRHEQSLTSMSVAQKMSWAAKRETTKIEDMAYCLLGIFNVYMPLIYGEEGNAFQRLQESIIKSTRDLSIFAWRMPSSSRSSNRTRRRYFCGVLAESPRLFDGCRNFTKVRNHGQDRLSISDSWVETKARILLQEIAGRQGYRYVLSLHTFRDTTPKQVLGIRLRMCGHDRYMREDPWNLVQSTDHLNRYPPRESQFLWNFSEMGLHPAPQVLDTSLFIAQMRSHIFKVMFPRNIALIEASPWGRYDDEDEAFILSGDSSLDFSILRLNIIYEEPGRRRTKFEFQCMFYAAGWSALHVEPQCTIVDYHLFSTKLKEVRSDLNIWDHRGSELADLLRHHGIPKSSAASCGIPGIEEVIVASFTTTLETNPKLCPNSFWKIKFSSEVYSTKDLPRIE